MVKYRRLSIDELKELEAEFIRFLASQSITADDWMKIKNNDQNRENELIDLFSDVVIDKSLYNIKYLEQRTAKRIICYKIEEKSITLQGLEMGNDDLFDFTTEFQLAKLVNLFEEDIDISFIAGSKDTENINKEIYDLIEEGAMISVDSTVFDFIITLKKHFSE